MGKTVLLSCVGDSDPIRQNHDGALLHIVRCKKPEKIVLLQSERSLTKKARIIAALNSIPDYRPEVIDDPYIIQDSEVYLFDRMFEIIDEKVEKYSQQLLDDEQLVLNLTSGTAAMIAAMFSVNRIKGLNVSAVQVTTPVKDSNKAVAHDSNVAIDELIASNLDNEENFQNRIVEDHAKRYGQEVLKKQARNYVKNYNYDAVFKLVSDKEMPFVSKGKTKRIRSIITKINNCLRYQKNLPETEKLNLSPIEVDLLNEYLVIILQGKRQFTSEVLMRVASLTESAAQIYLNNTYGDVIKMSDDGRAYLNVEKYPEIAEKQHGHEYNTQNLYGYAITLSMLESKLASSKHLQSDSVFTKHLKNVLENKQVRNTVSHTLNEVSENSVELDSILKDCYYLTFAALNVSKDWNNYFDEENRKLIQLLS